jgi:hypothetical protein
MIFILAVVLAFPAGASAEAVGRLTQVEGRVDLLKGGKLPATVVKVGDGVEQGDVLRTKSLSKAQITFKDNSIVTISPESRIAIEEYMVDADKGKRSALIQLFQGMILTAVSKIYQTEKPDFVVKTHTAIMGIRGTEVGIRLAANSSTFLNFQGLTRVSSAFPEIPGMVELKAMEATEVTRGLPPTLPYEIGPADRQMFMRGFEITAAMKSSGLCSSGSASGASATCGTTTTAADTRTKSAIATAVAPDTMVIPPPPQVIKPPVTPPAAPPPPKETVTFSENFAGTINSNTTNPTNAVFTFDTPGLGNRYDSKGTYLDSFRVDMGASKIMAEATKGTFSFTGTDAFTAKMNRIKLSGPVGGVLVGTMRMAGYLGGGLTRPNFIFKGGTVTLTPNGLLTYQANGIVRVGPTRGVATIVWTQQLTPQEMQRMMLHVRR